MLLIELCVMSRTVLPRVIVPFAARALMPLAARIATGLALAATVSLPSSSSAGADDPSSSAMAFGCSLPSFDFSVQAVSQMLGEASSPLFSSSANAVVGIRVKHRANAVSKLRNHLFIVIPP